MKRWWSDSMEGSCYLRNVQDLLADGKTPDERRFGEPFKRPTIPFGAVVEYHPSSPEDQSRIHQFRKKVLPGICLEGGIWKGETSRTDLEDLEMMDASDIYPPKIKAKEVLISQKDDEFIFTNEIGTAKFSGRDYEFREPTVRREQLVRSEDLSGDIQGESEESQPTQSTDDAEARGDFRSIQGDFIYRHQI